MRNWLNERKGEPTTYIGLALLVQAFGVFGKVDEAPAVAESVVAAAEPLARGDYGSAATLIVGGLLGVLLKEKGR